MSLWSDGIKSLLKDKVQLLKLILIFCVVGVAYLTGASFIFNLTHKITTDTKITGSKNDDDNSSLEQLPAYTEGKIITLADGTSFEGDPILSDIVRSEKFRVDGGYIYINNKALWKIINIEERRPTDEEREEFIVFKGEDYDVTFREGGAFSSRLSPFERSVAQEVQTIFDLYKNLSDEDCMKIVARKFDLPPTIVDMIFLKAALETGGRI